MSFWLGRRVLITGHTGFKGAWLSSLLLSRGAMLHGIALAPETTPALFDQLGLARRMGHTLLDIRQDEVLSEKVKEVSPEIVFHLAAQPLVRRSYREPVSTWAINVMGTAHLLQALERLNHPVAVVIVTTDKVYENREWVHSYREADRLGGHDPYAASKTAAEILVDSWRRSFPEQGLRIATARAGNVIGGGDWSEDRILPDLARARTEGMALAVRNPHAMRPWQHVLDPLTGYIELAEHLAGSADPRWQSAFNFGPEPADVRSVSDLVGEASKHWPGPMMVTSQGEAPHEAIRLALSIDKARAVLGWAPRWDFARAVAETMQWYRGVAEGAAALTLTEGQIAAFDAGAA